MSAWRKCGRCQGEGGWVAMLEDGEEDFIPCPDCDGRGFRGGATAVDVPGGLPSEREPFDVAWDRMERQSEDELRRQEHT